MRNNNCSKQRDRLSNSRFGTFNKLSVKVGILGQAVKKKRKERKIGASAPLKFGFHAAACGPVLPAKAHLQSASHSPPC